MKKAARALYWILATALVLRVIRLGSQSLWVDEILTFNVSSPKPGLNIWDYLKYNIHGALHAFVVYLFQLVSTSDAWLRLPSVIAGVAAVYFVYRWVRVWIDERTAVIVAGLLAIHPLHIYYSQELRNYSFLILFVALANYAFYVLLEKPSRGRYLAYVLAITGAALSNFTATFLFIAHTIVYIARNRSDLASATVRWLVVALCILVLMSPWVYRIFVFIDMQDLVTPVLPGDIEDTERLRGPTSITPELLPYTAFAFSVGFSMGPSSRELHYDSAISSILGEHGAAVLWVALLFGFVSVAGLVWMFRTRQERRWEVLLYMLAPIVFTLALNWQNAKAFNVRYVMIGLPAYLTLLAFGISSLRRKRAILVAVLMGVTMLAADYGYYFNGRYARDDVKRAVQKIDANAGDCVLAPVVFEVVQHYYDGPANVHVVYPPSATPTMSYDAQLAPILANCDRVWFVRAREWVVEPNDEILERMSAAYRIIERIEYDGVTLFLMAR